MPSPDRPQFIPPDTERNTIGGLKFRERPSGINLDAVPQPGRERTVIRTPAPEFDLVEAHFWRHSTHSHPRADLRDLVIQPDVDEKGRIETQNQLAQLLKSKDIEAKFNPRPSVRTEQGPTEEEMMQDEIPGHEDPFKRFFPKK